MIIYSRTALAEDTSGNLTRLKTIGPEQDSLKTNDQNSQQYLMSILEQLKIMNFYLSTLVDYSVDEVIETG
jgi:transcriptional regulator of NAD metabolism